MNEEQSTELSVQKSDGSGTAMSLVMDGNAMDKMMAMADLMASAKVTIPAHLRNNPGDCLAIIMQAAQWKMNAFAVAQKTHLSQSGQLGYEAQLINAVLVSTGAVRRQPEFEYIGDWSKILGKVEERKSDKGGKYYVAAWDKKDEEGLGIICRATLRGETTPREITVMMTQCYPRFSTQWATDAQQQISYVAVRKFGRRYAPGAILGVYDIDELDTPPMEYEINPAPNKAPPRQTGAQAADAARAAAAAAAQAADPAERAALIAKLEETAKVAGIEEYATAWKALTAKQRQMVGSDEHERLKKVATDPVPPIEGTATVVGNDEAPQE